MTDPREYTAFKFSTPPGACKCGRCKLVPPEQLVAWSDEILRLQAALRSALSFVDTALVIDENPTMSKRAVVAFINKALNIDNESTDARNPMSVAVPSPQDLQTLLATMKSAKAQSVNMSIWDRDIKTVEDAIAIIERLCRSPAVSRPDTSQNGNTP